MRIRVADYIADFLVNKGIEHVFSVTGGGAMFLNDGFGHKEGLKVIYNHHEQACAIAAESYARLTGNIAAVCVTSGPGGTNAITGVLGGWLDSIPMLIISGQVKFETVVRSTDLPLRQLGDQEFDITRTIKTMTKYAEMVMDANEIRYHLEKSYYLAMHGRKGPCWLDIPHNVQSAIIETEALRGFSPEEECPVPCIKESDVNEIIYRLQSAKRPVILAGSAIRLSGSENAFYQLIEKLNVPVVTAWNAHDILWDDHKLYFGRPGTVGERVGNFVTQTADVLLVLGCRLNIRQISYNWENFAPDAYKIIIDIDESELKKPTLKPDLPIHGDVAELINKILEKNPDIPPKKGWLDFCISLKNKYKVVTDKQKEKESPINPYVFVDEMTKLLPEDQVVVCGNGSACVCTFQAANIKQGQRYYTNSGCAAMGYDLPAALGAAVAARKKIVCLAGDGSIMMNLQELQTVKYNNLDIAIFIFNNDGYHSIRQTQKSFFNPPMVGLNAESGVSFPDWEKIAAGFDIEFYRIDKKSDISDKVLQILRSSGPAICEVVLDPEQFFEPKLSSRKLEDGTMLSASLEDMFPFIDREEFDAVMSIKNN